MRKGFNWASGRDETFTPFHHTHAATSLGYPIDTVLDQIELFLQVYHKRFEELPLSPPL